MKVYVDELPKCCADCDCPFNYDTCGCRLKEFIDVGDRKIEYFYENGRHQTCPLQSLSDYTKQVRKEVCKEIKKQIKSEYVTFYTEEDRKAFNRILKKIQGETDAKD